MSVLAPVETARAQTFEVVNLGTLPGTSASVGDAILDDGQVVGRSGSTLNRGFVWVPDTGMRDLSVPNPVAPGHPLRTNNAGQIVGLWTRAAANRPFLWNGATFVELPDPAPGWVQRLLRLTDGGMVLYEGPRSLCNQLTVALVGGVLYQVDQVLGACWAARDIADGPVVAGYRLVGGEYQAAVRAPNGQITAPSNVPGGQALRLGAGGHVVGTNGTNTGLFVTQPSGASAEFPLLLGTSWIGPNAVNRFGEVVGDAGATGVSARPFLIRRGRITELTSAVSGYTLVGASDINSRGHITGQARLPNGQLRAVIMRPTDRPLDFQASATGNVVTLRWTPPAGAPAGATYLLEVGSASGGTNVFSGNIGGGTTISGTVPNGTYFARLAMVYPDGAFGADSDELQFGVPVPPGPPTGLTHTLSGRTLTLAWTPPAGADAVEYVAEAGSRSGGTDLYNGSVGTSPGLSAAVAPRTYYIRIRARNAGGVGPASNEITVIVP